jgi:hypothetical protein
MDRSFKSARGLTARSGRSMKRVRAHRPPNRGFELWLCGAGDLGAGVTFGEGAGGDGATVRVRRRLAAASHPSSPSPVQRTQYRVPLDPRGFQATIITSMPSARLPMTALPSLFMSSTRATPPPKRFTWTRWPTAWTTVSVEDRRTEDRANDDIGSFPPVARRRYFTTRLSPVARRELSSITNVATRTSICLRQRGQRGVRVLAVTPSRYDSETLQ